ncbi:MAG: hypothetical protein ACC682_15790 [Gemmatimonadota bacterium]
MTDGEDTGGGDGASEHDDDGRIGIFPSWRALYITVLVYTAGLTVALYLMSRFLDHSAG